MPAFGPFNWITNNDAAVRLVKPACRIPGLWPGLTRAPWVSRFPIDPVPAIAAFSTSTLPLLARLPSSTSVPPITVVRPVKVFCAVNVIVPVPCLKKARPMASAFPLITPLNVVDALLPPVKSFDRPSSTLPLPASEPMVSVRSSIFNWPGLLIVTAV